MKTETRIVTNQIAGLIQMNATQYDCEIIETGLAGGNNVRISIKGTPENLDALFAYVESAETEPLNPEEYNPEKIDNENRFIN